MQWFLEKPVKEKEKEEAIRAGKQDPEFGNSAARSLSASALVACSILPVAKECSGTRRRLPRESGYTRLSKPIACNRSCKCAQLLHVCGFR